MSGSNTRPSSGNSQSNYNVYRADRGLSNNDIIRCLSTFYPGYSKAQNSMVNNPEKNGVRLLQEAEQILAATFGHGRGLSISDETKKQKNHSNKEKPRRLYLRLSEQMYNRVFALYSRMGFSTMQDLLEAAVNDMLIKYGG